MRVTKINLLSLYIFMFRINKFLSTSVNKLVARRRQLQDYFILDIRIFI